jgi:anti-sigma B factor antagonist
MDESPLRAVVRVAGGPAAPRTARLAVLARLDGRLGQRRATDVGLIVSELVTNSVRHAGVDADETIVVDVMLLNDRLRLAVADPGGGTIPHVVDRTPERPGGPGLVLVDQLSDRWGVERDGAGATSVWCELTIRAAHPETETMSDPRDVDPPPPQIFRVDARIDGRVATVAVFGDLDLSTVGVLRTRTHKLVGELELSQLILDLRGATFLDSTGIRLLLSLHDDARRDDYGFAIVRGPDAVHRALEIVGVEQQLLIVDDPAQALAGTD